MSYVGSIESPVLLVDDEIQILLTFSVILKSMGIKDVVTIEDGREVLPFLAKNRAAAIVLDLTMPFISGQEILVQVNQEYPEIPVLIITATSDIETAIECMKNGARDYLVKPVEKNRFISAIKSVLEIGDLRHEVSSLKNYLLTDNLKNIMAFAHIVTASPQMHAIFKYIEAIANSPFPILITGETGVGKELMAKAIHLANSKSNSFVAVNVAGLDDTMFSDTLFGHKKGAFTGANTDRDGLIATAEEGTLFLDEIGDLNQQSQIKLLRLIQEREYYKLGSDLPQKTNARLVVASNRDVKHMVAEGTFRKDLYFRLSAHQIRVPPLRERKEDIPLLTDIFLTEAAKSLNKKAPTYPPELITLFSTHEFSGNIRELQALIYDALSRHEAGILSLETFKKTIASAREDTDPSLSETDLYTDSVRQYFDNCPTIKQAEEYLINKALKQAKGNQGIAASLLGISRQALNKRLIRKKEIK